MPYRYLLAGLIVAMGWTLSASALAAPQDATPPAAAAQSASPSAAPPAEGALPAAGVGVAMSDAATKFLAALDPAKKKIATMAFDDPARLDWHNIPKPNRKGLALRDMTPEQRDLCHALLHTALSDRGYAKAQHIFALENNVRVGENGQPGVSLRDSGRYYLTIFAAPDHAGTWGWSFEGHHLSLNFVIKDGQVTSDTPTFWGANPATVKVFVQDGPEVGTRTLADEEQSALDLVAMLNESELAKAKIADKAPADYRAAGKPQPPITPAEGLPAKVMSDQEKIALRAVIDAYNANLAPDLAAARKKSIDADGFDTIYFAWQGNTHAGAPHAFRVQGPSFILEMVNYQSDLSGNPANHIHSVWRNLHGDFAVPMK